VIYCIDCSGDLLTNLKMPRTVFRFWHYACVVMVNGHVDHSVVAQIILPKIIATG